MNRDAETLEIEVFHHIQDIDRENWDDLGKGRPFQSHRWYQSGERVMSDCPATYLLVYRNQSLRARASFWFIRNEPLPEMPGILRMFLEAVFRRWPLLICRSPLVFTSGLVIRDDEEQVEEILEALSNKALELAKRQGVSMVMFDYISREAGTKLTGAFNVMSMSEPGTVMKNQWADFEDYIARGGWKNRKNYNRAMREMAERGVVIKRHSQVENLDEALKIIRYVEKKRGSSPNPWAGAMLENMAMVDGVFLTAEINGNLAGCGLLLEDNNTQTTSLLGHAPNSPFVYFMIVYESLKVAFEHRVDMLRWGSGVYDIKKRLGFSLEDNGDVAYATVNPLLHKIVRLIA